MRSLLVLTMLIVALAAAARISAAGEAVVVLDRGEQAEATTEALEHTTLRVLGALEARGFDTRLVVYGTRKNGRMRAATPRGIPAEALKDLCEREGWGFEGPTDPRNALEAALSKDEGAGPSLVVLVGPFARSDGVADIDEQAVEALATWNEEAPGTCRVFATGLSNERAALIQDARGRVARGTIVLAAGEVEAEAAPFSPFEDEPLRARIRVPMELLEAGGEPSAQTLRAMSADARDVIVATAPGTFDLERPNTTPRVATVSFDGSGPGVLWLADTPAPRTFRWADPKPDAALTALDGAPPAPFERSGVQTDAPFTRTYRLLRTRAGSTPSWRVQAVDGELPVELTVTFSAEAVATELTFFTDVVVTCRARPGFPLDRAGVLRLAARDHPSVLELPYRIQVPPGRVAVRLDAPDAPLALPASRDTAPWNLVVASSNANAPRLVRVEATLEPAELTEALTARLTATGGMEVAWDLAQPLELRPDVHYGLRLDLRPGVRGVEGTVRLRLPDQRGVEGIALGTGRIARRHPRLVASTATYRMDGGTTTGDPPLLLDVDADGGTGAWRLALLEVAPIVSAPPDAPFDVETRPQGPGRWVVVPTGGWRGARADTFTSRTRTLDLNVTWTAGTAPGRVGVSVVIEPRWGSVGWILVALAALALALGLWGATQLRAAPVDGTLLYTVQGREGAVGRLDLGPIGRRRTHIQADEAGRLHLGAPGTTRVATVKPTRVGGLLVVGSGNEETSHLLVDGLSLSTDNHGLRYVSGHPDTAVLPPVPAPEADLLGPEFDMGTGRIDALGRDTGEAKTDTGDADA